MVTDSCDSNSTDAASWTSSAQSPRSAASAPWRVFQQTSRLSDGGHFRWCACDVRVHGSEAQADIAPDTGGTCWSAMHRLRIGSCGRRATRKHVQTAGPGLRKRLRCRAFDSIRIGSELVEGAANEAKMK